MRIIVCPLGDVPDLCDAHRPSHVLTLLSPGTDGPALADHGARRLWLSMHDIVEPLEGLIVPDAALVDQLLAFSAGWTREQPLLVHCWAGISRSTAAAFVIACQHAPEVPEAVIAQTLRAASPIATPNPLIVALADALMRRNGRMKAAIAGIGRGRDAMMGQPFELRLNDMV
ncbi:MAG: hypothetical protein JWO33_2779 [Caulobacteraceae bacterium]|nr:hypothetical protein [Caulobacteraceae bacterium]